MQNDNKSETCSCESCTEPKTCLYYDKRNNKRPANQGLYGLMIDTLSQQESAVEEQKNAYLISSKGSCYTTGSKTRGSDKKSKTPVKRTGLQPSDVCGLMMETLSRQESAVEEQKSAYVPQSKDFFCNACSKRSKSPAKSTGSQPLEVYGVMVDTMSRQDSAVDGQKSAYLPQSKGSCCIAGSKTRGSDKQSKTPVKRTGSQPSGIYGLIVNTLSRQESAVEEQKSANLTQSKGSKGCCCIAGSKSRGSGKQSKSSGKRTGHKPSGVYGVMMDIMSQQEFAVERQKSAYLSQNKDNKKCKRTAVKDKKSAYPPPDCCSTVVTKRMPKLAGTDKLNATPSSSGPCTTEILKFVTEYKSAYSIQTKCSNCKSNNIPLDRRTSISSGSCKGMTRSSGFPCTCPSKSKSGSNNKKVYNVNEITTETKPTSYKSCSECSQLAKKKCEAPKYSAELKRYQPTKNAQELFRNILQRQAYKYENERDEYTKNIVSESPGHVVEPPKYTHNLTLQNDYYSNKSSTNVSKLSGYVHELQEYLTTLDTRKPVINTGEVSINTCEVKWIPTDANRSVLKACCNDDNLSIEKKFESCGYVVELPKDKEKGKCDCDDELFESSGYVVDLQKVKEKKKCNCNGSAKFGSDKPEGYFKKEKHTANENYSECGQLAKKKYDSPKYSTELKLYEPTKNTQELCRNTLQTQAYKHQNKRDECDKCTKNTVSESRGCELELPKYTPSLTLQNCCHSNQSTTNYSKLSGYVPNTRQPAIDTGEVSNNACQVKWIPTDANRLVLKACCHDDNLSTKKKFESCGYVVELPKVTEKGKCGCDDKLSGSSGYVVDLPKVKGKKKCNCNGSAKFGSDKSECAKKKYDSPKYSAELKLYEPRNILQTQAYKHQNKTDECDKCTKNIVSESRGYVLELPKCTPSLTLQNCCHSLKSTTREPAMNTGEVNINRCQAKWIPTDANSLVLKASCHDDNAATKKKIESCGYVVELPKVEGKGKCGCDDKLSGSSGYVVDLPKVKGKKNCNCNGSAKFGSEKSECDFKQEKHTANENCCQLAKKKYDSPKKRSGCQKCASTEFVARALPKYTENAQEPSRSGAPQKSCEYPESECKHNACEMKSIEVPGYVFEIPKDTRNSCSCNKLSKVQSGTTTETVKAVKSLKSPHATNIYTMLCNNILKKQSKIIEVLKNIYLPRKGNKSNAMKFQQKKFELQTKTCCPPLQNLTKPSDDETEILSTGVYSNECLVCKLMKSSQYSFENDYRKKHEETMKRLKKVPEKSDEVKFDVQTHTCCTAPDEGIEKLSAKEFGGSRESNSSYTISKCDLLKRIKDVYKACSCKICECKPTKTNTHECQKHCNRDECLSPILSMNGMSECHLCGGKPCDSVECIKTMNIHHCQTLLVAPLGRKENVSRLECTPCFEGGIVYPLESHIVNEMSTSMNRHATCLCEICLNGNCDRNGFDACHKHNKIMSKPVGPDPYDFDIHTTKVVYDKPMFRQIGRNYTEAMCLAVRNRYPSIDDRLNNTQTYRCKQCECIYCGAQKTVLTTL